MKCQHKCVCLKPLTLRRITGTQSLFGQDDMPDFSPVQKLLLLEIRGEYLDIPECDLSGVKALYRRCTAF